MQQVCHRLQELLELLNARLPAFSEVELEMQHAPGKWSRKQILGHLIDSAANNHRRFILASTRPEPLVIIPYDQDEWVRLANYQHTPATDLLSLWTCYNRQLIRIIGQLPAATLHHPCEFDNGYGVTLGWLIEDYVMHLEQHVQQILGRTPR